MNWTSLSDFIHMNGHGYYVWCSYFAFAAGVVYELFSIAGRRRRIYVRILREARAAQSTLER